MVIIVTVASAVVELNDDLIWRVLLKCILWSFQKRFAGLSFLYS